MVTRHTNDDKKKRQRKVVFRENFSILCLSTLMCVCLSLRCVLCVNVKIRENKDKTFDGYQKADTTLKRSHVSYELWKEIVVFKHHHHHHHHTHLRGRKKQVTFPVKFAMKWNEAFSTKNLDVSYISTLKFLIKVPFFLRNILACIALCSIFRTWESQWVSTYLNRIRSDRTWIGLGLLHKKRVMDQKKS